MEKKVINELIFREHRRYSNFNDIWSWGEVQELLKKKNIELLPTDTLQIGYEQGYQDGDSSQDPYYFIWVHRDRPETDAEFEKRKEGYRVSKEQTKERRYKLYLELKEEFGDETTERS